MSTSANFGPSVSRTGRFVERAHAVDLQFVRIATRSARPWILKRLAVAISRLGNGWIYPILIAVILIRWGHEGIRIIASALATAGLLHSFYPKLKRLCLRARPFVADASLQSSFAPLDRYSFPSGHTMTMTGVFVPIVAYWPAILPATLIMGCGLAWSRLATAHHYPSDVLAGVALGLLVGYPVALCFLSLW
jgi:undecaprenyl-diphosphatase